MKKSERINDMMLYLSDKHYFNLRDIMHRYDVSKSTALRDIQSLESIGMPIYSEQGRHGRYGILKNRLLSPIVFTLDELHALYFSMLTLKAYESTPFHLDVERLKSKFESCLAPNHILSLKRMEQILKFASSVHSNSSPLLKEMLQAAIDEQVCQIIYVKSDKTRKFTVQFFDISSAFGQWYVSAFNHETQKVQVFRCDKVVSVSPSSSNRAIPLDQLFASSPSLYRAENAIDFEVEITKEGVDLYHKENYPSMKLYRDADRYLIKGYYNPGEETFIAGYFLSYGKQIKSISPFTLKTAIYSHFQDLTTYYTSLL